MSEAERIRENIAHVCAEIDAACQRAGRDPADVTLIAVSKQKPAAAVLAALEAGVQHFGENRVEESEWKIPQVAAQALTKPVWHMIGHLQSRKAKALPGLLDVLHSLDSVKLAEKLSQQLAQTGGTLEVLLQMNVSGEVSKEGFQAVGWQTDAAVFSALCVQAAAIAQLPGLRLRGLMTMAPIADDPEVVRPFFASLAALRAALSAKLQIALPDLSMGMTDDYPVAIEEGATFVRIGRALFGERQ